MLPHAQYPPNEMSLSVMAMPTASSNQLPLNGAALQRPPAMQTNMAATPANENAAFSNSAFVHPEEARVMESVNQNGSAGDRHPIVGP